MSVRISGPGRLAATFWVPKSKLEFIFDLCCTNDTYGIWSCQRILHNSGGDDRIDDVSSCYAAKETNFTPKSHLQKIKKTFVFINNKLILFKQFIIVYKHGKWPKIFNKNPFFIHKNFLQIKNDFVCLHCVSLFTTFSLFIY